MPTLRKHALMTLGVLTLASFANIANAANPFEQINQEVDKYQQRGRERADEVARDNCINIFVSNQPSAIAEIR